MMTRKKLLNARLINSFILIVLASVSIFLLNSCICCKDSKNADLLILQDHPLVDKIWDINNRKYIVRTELFALLAESKYLLLGETHDNISHHRHQAEIIADLHRAQHKVSMHFEMIDDQQAAQIDKAGYSSVDELVKMLSSPKAGWNYDTMYRPVFEQTMQSNYKIFPANLDHKHIRRIFAEGEQHIPDDVKKIMNEVILTTDQKQSMEREIIKGHCNIMPGEMLKPMLLTQQVRDARMALSLLKATADTRVLITGSGHARKDRGVPLYLNTHDKNGQVISIALIEVEEDKFNVDDYKSRWDAEEFPFDYIWFTPQYDRPDPCEGLEQRLKSE